MQKINRHFAILCSVVLGVNVRIVVGQFLPDNNDLMEKIGRFAIFSKNRKHMERMEHANNITKDRFLREGTLLA